MYRRFIWKISLFLAPYALAAAAVSAVLGLGGELVSAERAAARQQADPSILYGPAYWNPDRAFKQARVLTRPHAVLALGTSRVLQFRAEFFSPRPEVFYNAGRGVETIQEFIPFLEQIPPANRPRVLIIGLDQFMFNANWDPVLPDTALPPPDTAFSAYAKFRRVIKDYLKGSYKLADLLRDRDPDFGLYTPLGLNAKANSCGFRADGSYAYGDIVFSPDGDHHNGFADVRNRIANGNLRFEYGDAVSERALRELDRLLQYCEQRDIQLAAILPPFPHALLTHMADSGHYGYLKALPQALTARFDGSPHHLFDFSDPHDVGSSDQEFIDGLHGSEVAYLRMLMTMAKQVPGLNACTQQDHMEQLLADRQSPLALF